MAGSVFMAETTETQEMSVSFVRMQHALPVLLFIKKEFIPNSYMQTLRH